MEIRLISPQIPQEPLNALYQKLIFLPNTKINTKKIRSGRKKKFKITRKNVAEISKKNVITSSWSFPLNTEKTPQRVSAILPGIYLSEKKNEKTSALRLIFENAPLKTGRGLFAQFIHSSDNQMLRI